MYLVPGEPVDWEKFATAVLNILFTDCLVHKRFAGNLFVRAVKGCALSSFATVFFVFVCAAARAWPNLHFLPSSIAKILLSS